MSNLIKIIHNVETNEIQEKPFTEEEIQQYEIDKNFYEMELQKIAETKSLKQALLDKLGISEEEAKILSQTI